MHASKPPRLPLVLGIKVSESLSDGLVIQFTDGKCAFYSTALLYGVLSQAVTQDEEIAAW